MSQEGPLYHRLGQPGGPATPLAILPITTAGPDGAALPGCLLGAGPEANEVEMLRTIASRLGIQWGHDEHGWWAVLRGQDFPSWAVWRQDDSGSKFLMAFNLLEAQARQMVREFEEKGHKQTYWCADMRHA